MQFLPVPEGEIVDRYVEALHKEIDLVLPLLDNRRKVSQIHYGGGSPTVLPAIELEELNDHVLDKFPTIANPEIAVECHPGWIMEQGWVQLVKSGFNRLSIGGAGFQQGGPERRKPSIVQNPDGRRHGNPAFARRTCQYGFSLRLALPDGRKLCPDDRKSRCHETGPARHLLVCACALGFPRQQILEKVGLPSGDEKSRMFETAHRILCEADYQPIGLDHFVRKDDELYTASQNGQLHRNFQGYCTRRTTGQVYAFGVTGISQLGTAYAQNTKDIMEYIEKVEAGILPVAKGYLLSREEQITREAIEMLMCNYRIDWNELSEQLSTPARSIKQATAYDEAHLREFAEDGLIEFDKNQIRMTPEGRLFVRNIAASLDKLMLETNKSFSKPV